MSLLQQYNHISPNASSIRFNSGPVEPEPTKASFSDVTQPAPT